MYINSSSTLFHYTFHKYSLTCIFLIIKVKNDTLLFDSSGEDSAYFNFLCFSALLSDFW